MVIRRITPALSGLLALEFRSKRPQARRAPERTSGVESSGMSTVWRIARYVAFGGLDGASHPGLKVDHAKEGRRLLDRRRWRHHARRFRLGSSVFGNGWNSTAVRRT